jgi:transcriptional regulator with GAF, ATPase, and Fis domain
MEAPERGFFQAKLREYEARMIREALERARGNQARAARILGLPPTTLASQLRRLGIEAREFKRHISPDWPLVF